MNRRFRRILSLFLCAVLAFGVTAPTVALAQEDGEVETPTFAEVQPTPDGTKTIVSLLLDDNSVETAEWLAGMARTYGIRYSCMLIVDQLTQETVARYAKVFADGYLEPQSHSYTHNPIPSGYWASVQNPAWSAEKLAARDTQENYQHEFADSRTALEDYFPGSRVLTFAASNNTLSAGAASYLRTQYYAVRCGKGGMQTISATSPCVWTPGVNDRASGEDNNGIAAPGSWQNLFVRSLRFEEQYHTDTQTTGEANIKELDKYVAAGNTWFIGWGHKILSDYDRREAERFYAYVKKLSDRGDVRCMTFSEATKYIREYQNSTVTATTKGNTITVDLTVADRTPEGMSLSCDLFSTPLTVKVEVPTLCEQVEYRQENGATRTARAFSENGKKYVYMNLTPGAGRAYATVKNLEGDPVMDAILAAHEKYLVTQKYVSGADLTLHDPQYDALDVNIYLFNDPDAKPEYTPAAQATRADDCVEPTPANHYRVQQPEGGKPYVYYVINTQVPRIGKDSDADIIGDLLARGYAVVVLNYMGDARAVSPTLDWNVQALRFATIVGNCSLLGAVDVLTYYSYVLPAGYNLRRGVKYYNYEENAPAGVLDKIVEHWNSVGFRNYYGNRVIVWAEGKSVTEDAVWENEAERKIKIKYTVARTVSDCVKPDGSPIDLNLYLDLIYPTGGVEVPVMMEASSAETRPDIDRTAGRPHLSGFLFRGYAGAVFDHMYTPMAREDHYGYYEGSGAARNVFTLGDYTYISAQTAAVRCLRWLSDTYDEYNFREDAYGAWGHSKAAWVNMLGTAHPENLSEKDVFTGEAAVVKTVPFATYRNGKAIPSGVQVVYSSNGGGTSYVFPDMVPTVVTQGENDGFWYGYGSGGPTHYFALLQALKQYDRPSLGMSMPGVGHTTIYGYSETLKLDMYDALFRFANYYLQNEAISCLYTTPTRGSAEVSATDPIVLKFTGPVSLAEICGVTICRMSDGASVAGAWTSAYGETEWTFTPASALTGGAAYRVTIPAGITGSNGVPATVAQSFAFRVECEEEIAPAHRDGTALTDTEGRVFLSFDKSDFSLSVDELLRFRVTNDAVNRVAVYTVTSYDAADPGAAVLGDLVGTVAVNGAGVYELDIRAALRALPAGTAPVFCLKVEKNPEIITITDVDFDTVTSTPWQSLSSNVVEDPTNPDNKVRKYSTFYSLLMNVFTNGLKAEDLGRRIRISFDFYSSENRTLLAVIQDKKESGVLWADFTFEGMTTVQLPAGEWVQADLTYNLNDPDFILYNKYPLVLYVTGSTIGGNELHLMDNLKVTETVTGVTLGAVALVTHPTVAQTVTPIESGWIQNGDSADETMTGALRVSARVGEATEAKAYAKIDLASVPTNRTALFTIRTDAVSQGRVQVYGVADPTLAASWTADTITAENAPASAARMLGVDLAAVFGGQPLGTFDVNGAGDYTLNITDYIFTMKAKGATAATLIFVAEGSSDGVVIFRFVEKPTEISTPFSTTNFDDMTDLVFAPTRGDNVFGTTDVYMQGDYQKASVTLADREGGGKCVKIAGTTASSYNVYKFWKPLGMHAFKEEDVGTTLRITFDMKQTLSRNILVYLSCCGYTTTGYMGTNENLGYQTKTITAAQQTVGEWGTYTVEFTVDASMVGALPTKAETDTRPVLFSVSTSYAYGSDVYIDNIRVEQVKKIAGDAKDFYREVMDFEDGKLPSRNGIGGSDIGIDEEQNTTAGGTRALYNKVNVTWGRIFFPVLNAADTALTAADVGDIYTISFRMKASGSGSFLASLANTETATATAAQNAWVKKMSYTKEDVGKWVTFTYEVTVTEDMLTPKTAKGEIAAAPNFFCLYLNGFGTSGVDLWIDDVTSYRNWSDNGTFVTPSALVTVTDTETSAGASVRTDHNYDGIRKSYLRFPEVSLAHLRRVTLTFTVPEGAGEILKIWGITSSWQSPLTWNNAPAGTATESMNAAEVLGGTPLATVTAKDGVCTAEVLTYVLAREGEELYFAVTTTDGEGKVLTLTDPTLTVYTEEETEPLFTPAIAGASMSVSSDLTLHWYATLPAERADALLRVGMNGKTFLLSPTATGVSGEYLYTFTGIGVQNMTDTITATLLWGREVMDEKKGFTVRSYAESLLSQTAEELSLTAEKKQRLDALVYDLLRYGSAAQTYTGYRTDCLAGEGYDALATDIGAGYTAPTERRTLSTPVGTHARLLAGNVRFDCRNALVFRFRTDDITKTAIAGYTVAEAPDAFEKNGDGEWLFTLPQTLGVLDFDTARTVELTYDGTIVQTLGYSLNAYAYAVGQKTDTDGNLTAGALLARAAYTFGVRAEAYAAD